jgi:hypothetical protein
MAVTLLICMSLKQPRDGVRARRTQYRSGLADGTGLKPIGKTGYRWEVVLMDENRSTKERQPP